MSRLRMYPGRMEGSQIQLEPIGETRGGIGNRGSPQVPQAVPEALEIIPGSGTLDRTLSTGAGQPPPELLEMATASVSSAAHATDSSSRLSALRARCRTTAIVDRVTPIASAAAWLSRSAR